VDTVKLRFYTENGDFYWYDLGIKKNTDSFLKSLIKFKKDIERKIFLSLDRAPWHKSKKAREFFQKNKYWLLYCFSLQLLQIGTQQYIVGK
jgi:putative transposase